MVGLRESWCFCKGVSKSERMKAAIFSGKAPATARISGAGSGVSGSGFLIHRNLLLTTHASLPSASAAEIAEIRLQSGVAATLIPHRFFITSSVLDLTIVGLDSMEGDSNSQGQHPHYLKTCSKPNLDLGSVVYLLGYTDKEELTVGEGKVVIATDNLIKLSTDGAMWSPGSAGFDAQGNLAFMICDPMKLASSPTNKSSSTSSSSFSWKNDFPMQFGIPIPIICDWLSQHWEGSSLDDLNKPKLPIIRLISTGQKSEHSCASFALRRVFKSTEGEEEETPSPSNAMSRAMDSQPGPRHVINAIPVREKHSGPVQLLDINFPPRVAKPVSTHHYVKYLYPSSGDNFINERQPDRDAGEVGSTRESPAEIQPMQSSYSSEGETMYSAETAESRNYSSPREAGFRQVGRSHSCVSSSYNRWGSAQRNPAAHGSSVESRRSFFVHGRKVNTHGGSSQRSNDYYRPTMSSIMKKRHNSEHNNRPKLSAVVHSSPEWNF